MKEKICSFFGSNESRLTFKTIKTAIEFISIPILEGSNELQITLDVEQNLLFAG